MGTVRITQLDGKLPNLALMRLSAFHRARGDDVVFSRSPHRGLFEPDYDRVYGSAIFRFSATLIQKFSAEFPGAIVGGTGTDSDATVESFAGEGAALDYGLYPDFSASLGFTQRGCRLSCKFCVVPGKEGKARATNTIDEIWRGDGHPKHLHLLDNDFFGQPPEQWRARIAEIRAGAFKVCFNQGLNVRLIDQSACEALATVDYRGDDFKQRRIYTAWDNLKDESVFFRGVDMLESAGIPPSHLRAYMLIGFDKRETWERIWHRFNRMVDRGIEPFPMVFDCRATDPDRYVSLKRFQRWVVRRLYKYVPWDDYLGSISRTRIDRRNERGGLLSLMGDPT